MAESKDDTTSPVQPVMRSFRLLEALNMHAPSSLAALHQATDLPKPTLVRLLDTLIAGGYVTRLPRRGGYTLTERVLRLSGGFKHSDQVVEAGRPFLSALTARYRWPVAMATLDRDAMLVRLSTGHESPFVTDPALINKRLPMLVAALGRAYIAFCPDAERDAILAMLRSSNLAANSSARDTRHVNSLIKRVRRLGYASTAPVPGDPAMGLAVPVIRGDEVLACITMRYIGSAMNEAEAVTRYLVPMQETAKAIAASLTREAATGASE
ncbi:MAG: DNA-binding transcriptional regulator [Rhizobiales bacterium]|nr:DNA-binding transcriptional regulator [Hyphomicrobiales bacterium]